MLVKTGGVSVHMRIYVHRNEQMYGPYEVNAVRSYLQSGEIVATDQACYEGQTQWQPVGEMSEFCWAKQSPQQVEVPVKAAVTLEPKELVKEVISLETKNPEEALRALVAKYRSGKSKDLFVAPNIPKDILATHQKYYLELGPGEEPLVMINRAIWHVPFCWNGLTITNRAIHYRALKNSFSTVCGKVSFDALQSADFGFAHHDLGFVYVGHQFLLNGEDTGFMRMGMQSDVDAEVLQRIRDCFAAVSGRIASEQTGGEKDGAPEPKKSWVWTYFLVLILIVAKVLSSNKNKPAEKHGGVEWENRGSRVAIVESVGGRDAVL